MNTKLSDIQEITRLANERKRKEEEEYEAKLLNKQRDYIHKRILEQANQGYNYLLVGDNFYFAWRCLKVVAKELCEKDPIYKLERRRWCSATSCSTVITWGEPESPPRNRYVFNFETEEWD